MQLVYHGLVIAMHYKFRSSSNRVLLFTFAFVAMQTYALYMSTFHKFHNMPPMCQLCATVEKYENSIASNTVLFPFSFSIEVSNELVPQQVFVIPSSIYKPRAPPLLS